jgi:hypothetical protein
VTPEQARELADKLDAEQMYCLDVGPGLLETTMYLHVQSRDALRALADEVERLEALRLTNPRRDR